MDVPNPTIQDHKPRLQSIGRTRLRTRWLLTSLVGVVLAAATAAREQVVAREHMTGIPGERSQKLELRRRELHLLLARHGLDAAEIDHEAAETDLLRAVRIL